MTIINVGMGEIQITKSPGTILTAPGLGSCIGLIMYDSKSKIAGMAHVVLPDSTSTNKEITLEGKYADLAVPALLDKLIKMGAIKQNIIVKIAGGSQMFNFDKGSNILNIGMRNTIAVKTALSKENLTVRAADTGGNKGRTMRYEVSTSITYVKSIGQSEVEL